MCFCSFLLLHLSDSALATCQLAAQRLSYCTALKDARLSCKQYCQTCRGKVVIIGAGPAGSTAAILLSKRGYSVEVYETRPHLQDPIDLKRTYIIALSERGLKAMRAAGVRIPSDAPYKGFVRHLKGSKIQVMTQLFHEKHPACCQRRLQA